MTPTTKARALVVDADPAVTALLDEWLAELGFSVTEEPRGGHRDLILVDVPYPRLGAPELLRRLAREYPRTPILALSSNFFAGAGESGAVAKSLGVSAVVPKPVTRVGLVNAVNKAMAQAA
jgi:CheY-like chemotaxis protein